MDSGHKQAQQAVDAQMPEGAVASLTHFDIRALHC
jgi:hypothetical protein